MKIYLYLAIPSAASNKPINRTGIKYFKNRLRRLFDLAEWTLLRRTHVHYNTFEDRKHSNRGDIALQQAVNADLKNLFADRPVEIQEIAWGDLDEALLHDIDEDGDLFVIGGSGYLHINNAGELNTIFRQDLPLLQRMKCPAATLGIGINYVLMSADALSGFSFSRNTERSFADFSTALDLISVRDKRAQTALENDTAPALIADPALFFPGKSIEVHKQKETETIRIGLNFSLHGSDSQSTLHRNLPIYAKTLKALQSRHNIEYVYFLHSDAERFIWRALTIAGVRSELIDQSPRDMLDVYQSVDIHICQMMHSSIMSMSVCTPTLNLAYDVKILSFFELMGIEDLAINAYTITQESLTTAIEAMLEDRDEIHQRLRAKVRHLHEDYKAFLTELRSITVHEPNGVNDK